MKIAINKERKVVGFGKFLLAFGVFGSISLSNALEFGTMGNVSASMGGAGVALKSPFALYYNPALIASDSKTRIGYSLGIGMEQSNLDKLTNLNFTQMLSSLTSLGSQMGGGSKGITRNAASASGGARAASNLQGALTEALQASGATGGNLEALWKDYQQKNPGTDHSQLVGNLQNAVNSSTMSQEQKDMFNDLAGSIDWSDFDVSGGKITSVNIKAGSNGALDAAMKDLDTLFEVLKNNNMSITSQSGIVFQLSNQTLQERFGSLAVGMFNTMQAGVSLIGDSSKMRLIFGDTSGYYELTITDNGYTLKESTADDYNKYSILASVQNGNAHKVVSSIFNLTEVPIGYAYSMDLGGNNKLSIGVTAKAMLGSSLYHEQYLSSNLSFNTNFNSNTQYAFAMGVDLGAYYAYGMGDGELGLGFVAKNINYPTFRFDKAPTIVIEPQYRTGIAYNGKRFSLAFDADILPNRLVNYSPYGMFSQMVGGGFKLDYRYVDVRGGLAYDLKRDMGVILTAGVNVLGFLDVSLEVGTKWVDYFGVTAPKYANLRIGGSFSW